MAMRKGKVFRTETGVGTYNRTWAVRTKAGTYTRTD